MNRLSVVASNARLVHFGSLTLDLDENAVSHAGHVVTTTPAEFSVLRLLVAHRDTPMCKGAIADAVYGPAHGRDPRLVDVFVARLRRSLAAAGAGQIIATVPGRGYAVVDDDEAEHSFGSTPPAEAVLPLHA